MVHHNYDCKEPKSPIPGWKHVWERNDFGPTMAEEWAAQFLDVYRPPYHAEPKIIYPIRDVQDDDTTSSSGESLDMEPVTMKRHPSIDLRRNAPSHPTRRALRASFLASSSEQHVKLSEYGQLSPSANCLFKVLLLQLYMVLALILVLSWYIVIFSILVLS